MATMFPSLSLQISSTLEFAIEFAICNLAPSIYGSEKVLDKVMSEFWKKNRARVGTKFKHDHIQTAARPYYLNTITQVVHIQFSNTTDYQVFQISTLRNTDHRSRFSSSFHASDSEVLPSLKKSTTQHWRGNSAHSKPPGAP